VLEAWDRTAPGASDGAASAASAATRVLTFRTDSSGGGGGGGDDDNDGDDDGDDSSTPRHPKAARSLSTIVSHLRSTGRQSVVGAHVTAVRGLGWAPVVAALGAVDGPNRDAPTTKVAPAGGGPGHHRDTVPRPTRSLSAARPQRGGGAMVTVLTAEPDCAESSTLHGDTQPVPTSSTATPSALEAARAAARQPTRIRSAHETDAGHGTATATSQRHARIATIAAERRRAVLLRALNDSATPAPRTVPLDLSHGHGSAAVSTMSTTSTPASGSARQGQDREDPIIAMCSSIVTRGVGRGSTGPVSVVATASLSGAVVLYAESRVFRFHAFRASLPIVQQGALGPAGFAVAGNVPTVPATSSTAHAAAPSPLPPSHLPPPPPPPHSSSAAGSAAITGPGGSVLRRAKSKGVLEDRGGSLETISPWKTAKVISSFGSRAVHNAAARRPRSVTFGEGEPTTGDDGSPGGGESSPGVRRTGASADPTANGSTASRGPGSDTRQQISDAQQASSSSTAAGPRLGSNVVDSTLHRSFLHEDKLLSLSLHSPGDMLKLFGAQGKLSHSASQGTTGLLLCAATVAGARIWDVGTSTEVGV
jgi:hypothetical protein